MITKMSLTIVIFMLTLLIAGCASKPFSEIRCSDIQDYFEGETLTNSFGASSKIISIRSASERSRSETMLTCVTSSVRTSAGTISATLTAEDTPYGVWYELRQG